MKLRAGTIEDMASLLPRAPGRRVWRRFVLQAKRTPMFAAEDKHGLAAAGGLYDDGSGELEAWILIRREPMPSARVLALAAAETLFASCDGRPIVCHVDQAMPKHRRYAEFLGFVSQTGDGPLILGRRTIRMVWNPA